MANLRVLVQYSGIECTCGRYCYLDSQRKLRHGHVKEPCPNEGQEYEVPFMEIKPVVPTKETTEQ